MKSSKTFFVPILIIFGLLLSACGGEATPEPTPTLSLEAMQTLAVATFSAQLTQTALAADAGFKFAFTGGDAMGGSTYTLPQSVAANAEIDISVSMTAPTNKTGAVRGNWRISTAAGQFFGDEVYVQIQVGGAAATNTSAPAATATSTPSTPAP